MDPPGQDFSVEQVAQAQDGDQDAFARMVAAYHHDVVRVCFLVCGSLDTAEDSAQTTWAQVWRRLKTLRDPTRLRAWILAIAANEARQQVRRERVRRLLLARSSEVSVDSKPRDLDLEAVLRSLSTDDRRLLALRHVGGLSSIEIGALLHSSAPAIRMRLSRLHERLRKELEDA